MISVLPAESKAFLSGKTVYCGFSGGADSLTLLLLLAEVQEAFHFTLNAIHFEHGIRGRAGEKDAQFCRNFCMQNNIQFQCVPLNVLQKQLPGEGVEAAARRLRMDFWKSLPANCVVALGHNADDLTENLILRLMRGSNVSALTSLAEWSEVEHITFFRPLLAYTKNEIMEYLQGRGHQWRTDSTNLKSEYGRNFIRNQILPQLYAKFPYAQNGISRSLKNLSEDAQFIENETEKYYKSADFSKRNSWTSLPEPIFCRIFRNFIKNRTGMTVFSGHNLIERFRKMIFFPPGQGFAELIITDIPDYSIFVDSVSVFIVFNRKIKSQKWDLTQKSSEKFSFFEFKAIRNDVFSGKGDGVFSAAFDPVKVTSVMIRPVQNGDKMIPFGKNTPVSVNTLLSNAKIPKPLRINYPVLCDENDSILWIPGVRRSNLYPARDTDFLTISVSESFH